MMKYILNYSQIDNLMKPFWDEQFDDTRIGKLNLSGEIWSGIIKDDEIEGPILLIGQPEGRTEMMWYSNGQYFNGKWDIFNLSSREFNDAMGRYINKTYGLNVVNLI